MHDSTYICQGDSVKLSAANGTGNKYYLNTGPTTRSIEAKSTGDYFYTVTDAQKCINKSYFVCINVNCSLNDTIDSKSGKTETVSTNEVVANSIAATGLSSLALSQSIHQPISFKSAKQ